MIRSIIKQYLTEEHKIKLEKDEKDEIEKHVNFANWNIKFELLQNAVLYLNSHNILVNCLLDLASGRGNDMNRWIKLNIPNVIGIDFSEEQIKEAINRIKKHKDKIKVSYVHGSMADPVFIKNVLYKFIKNNKVNLITNNFAMNYIFDSEQNINNFFQGVSDSLNTGGLFIGTATDGDVINYLYENVGNNIQNKLYSIQKINENKYKFKLNTPFFKEEYIEEYIINKKKLLEYAYKFNLYPVQIIKGVEPISNFCRFPIKYERPIGIASLYFSFSFIKGIPQDVSKFYSIYSNIFQIEN